MRQRDASVDFLRCLLMFLIVLHHCCIFGIFGKRVEVGGLSVLTAFATDCFVAISGWYGVSLTRTKLFRLLGCGVFASVVLSVVGLLMGCGIRFSMGWFGWSYLALMGLAPLINAGIEKFFERDKKILLASFGVYTLCMIGCWLPGFECVAGWRGHSFNTLLYIYVLMRLVRMFGVADKIKTKSWLLSFLACMALNVFWAWMGNGSVTGLRQFIFCGTRDFNAPWIVCAAVSFFMLFRCARVPLGQLTGFLGPSMFTVYLLHEGSFPNVSRGLICSLQSELQPWTGGGVLTVIASAVLVYFACAAIDLIRRVIVK